jgi:hypothetical protein
MPCGSANTKDMKEKARVIVVEYATLKEEYLAEKGTMEGFEESIARMEQQLREIVARRTRPDGTVEPLYEADPTWRKKSRTK